MRGLLVISNMRGEIYRGQSTWYNEEYVPKIDQETRPVCHSLLRPGDRYSTERVRSVGV